MLAITGYASVFGNTDSAGEIVDRGAFGPWLAAHRGEQLPILYQHDYLGWMPVGVTSALVEDQVGLKFDGVILDETRAGNDLAALMSHGAINGASFAYKTISEYQTGELWHLAELDIYEISVVFRGANPRAYAVPHGKSAPPRHLKTEAAPRIYQPSAAEIAAIVGDVLAA